MYTDGWRGEFYILMLMADVYSALSAFMFYYIWWSVVKSNHCESVLYTMECCFLLSVIDRRVSTNRKSRLIFRNIGIHSVLFAFVIIVIG